ncbi:unnamed protein product [Paramecium octaurelia]|uniref:Uncharacterized protein n=1 Tax=Paramecium octaurelia TaxID=43137 RepID=A0A8S1T3R5_PAROT|nr:unnamed protein product [Paramecium octaurelia]
MGKISQNNSKKEDNSIYEKRIIVIQSPFIPNEERSNTIENKFSEMSQNGKLQQLKNPQKQFSSAERGQLLNLS